MSEPMYFSTPAAFRDWLAEHGATATELHVGYHKLGSGVPSMTWPESVDEALCQGWIDGVRNRVDALRYRIRFTPRRPTSIWSRVNIDRVAVLTQEGRMRAPGLAAFERRTAERSNVYAYEQQDDAVLPAAMGKAFKRQRTAWAWFEAQPPGWRRQMLRWVLGAKQEATRERRLALLMAAAAEGRRL